jgi:hypothetical protein
MLGGVVKPRPDCSLQVKPQLNSLRDDWLAKRLNSDFVVDVFALLGLALSQGTRCCHYIHCPVYDFIGVFHEYLHHVRHMFLCSKRDVKGDLSGGFWSITRRLYDKNPRPCRRLLIYAGTADGRWIGYVDEDGVCEWPDQVRKHRPTGWQEVIADLSRIIAVRFGGGL